MVVVTARGTTCAADVPESGVRVRVAVGVGVTVRVEVLVAVGVLVRVRVGVAVGVAVRVEVRVDVRVKVSVGVPVRVAVAVDVRVRVRVAVALAVAVGVDVGAKHPANRRLTALGDLLVGDRPVAISVSKWAGPNGKVSDGHLHHADDVARRHPPPFLAVSRTGCWTPCPDRRRRRAAYLARCLASA